MKRAGLLVAVLLAGCSASTGLDEGQVSARFQNESIVAENSSSVAIYYTVVNPMSTVLWAPCSTPDNCPRIPRSSGVTITADRILGWNDSVETLDFYYWALVSDGRGGYKPDRLRQIRLTAPR